MCRHVAYLGPPIALAPLLTDADHSLLHQARASKHQDSGPENPHGYGVGWWDATGALHLHRTATPIWEDPELATLAHREQATAVLGAVRLASPGLPVEATGNAPFTDGTWLFSLNGRVDAWHDGAGDALRATVTPRRAATIEGHSDSEVCFALVLDAIDAGASPGDALCAVAEAILQHSTARLNFLLTDGRSVAATAWDNSLFTRVDDDVFVVASEPLDGHAGWERVPDRTLITVDGGVLTRTPIAKGPR